MKRKDLILLIKLFLLPSRYLADVDLNHQAWLVTKEATSLNEIYNHAKTCKGCDLSPDLMKKMSWT